MDNCMSGLINTVQPYLRLSHLTFREVEKEIARCPALILPLGGCEPCGECGTLGTASAVVEAMATALSSKLHLLLAPTLAFSCSTPYSAFGGGAGVKPRTLTNILCETSRHWYGQGFRTVILLDGLFDNGEAVDKALRRLKNIKPEMTIFAFAFQRDERVRAFIGQHIQGKEYGRTEYGLSSLAACIDPGLVRQPQKNQTAAIAPDLKCFDTWRKRGADPERYRKLFPSAFAGSRTFPSDAAFGKELFAFILQLLVDTLTPVIKSHK